MKKTIVILMLLGLVIWGVYDINKNNIKPLNHAETEQSGTEEMESNETVGLEKGNIAPDFTLPTLEGENLKLSDYRGKKVILNMWATWCPPCIAEMPHLQSFYKDHKTEGVAVFAINLTQAEKNRKDIPGFIADYELTFPVVLDEKSQVADLYQVTTIPTTYILDSKGRIEQKIVGPMTYDMMDEIMKQVE
ncbi:peroxiredoxin family protein [Paenibacillus nasutitermitis]|uniref:Thiol:disulfide interchange protein tlpA n=1 Tax=Paenibacillus nasutitermitis TaxID=1652958 RepID=A0A917DZJ7_9BACL|nr:TlpA disulfide reductase family protein [Paenibacillus nasutitermitis]GGD83724.1 thiol:disulfide interchange protein tlpA [Paenibacillus nasutitermitis]